MTVCIAAICNVGPGRNPRIVAASDRMITIDDIEYEPAQTKIFPLATQTVALLAGEMEVHAAILPSVFRSLRDDPPPGLLVSSIAQRVADEYATYRRKKAEREILFPLGLGMDSFLIYQKEMQPDLVIELTNKLFGSSLNAPMIIAGIDQNGAHIFKIVDPGSAVDFGIPCFAAIGIGRSHAESQMMLARFDKAWPLADTVFQVFSAKTRAESAAGVGSTTDVVIISAGGYEQSTQADTETLRVFFNEKDQLEQVAQRQAYARTAEFLDFKVKQIQAAREADSSASPDSSLQSLPEVPPASSVAQRAEPVAETPPRKPRRRSRARAQ